MRRVLLLLFLGVAALQAANDFIVPTTRPELLFTLNSSLKTQNAAALATCFNFEGADAATREAYARVIKRMCTWVNPIVETSERSGSGQLQMSKDGRPVHLNGEWTFQVHIYADPGKKQGFVFPAGDFHGKVLVLLAIPD